MFFYLTDKEAVLILKESKLFHTSTEDLPIEIAQTNLCILLKGKVSLCQKVQAVAAPVESPAADKADEKDKEKSIETPESPEKDKGPPKEKRMSTSARRTAVIQMVTALLERRATLKEEERAQAIEADRRKESLESSTGEGGVMPFMQQELFNRTTLYGKSTVHFSEGSYFGGPDMTHRKNSDNNNLTDQFTYVSDSPCLLLVIPEGLQISIVNYHYLNLIRDKEKTLRDHHVTKRLTIPLRLALLHEMLEEHFIHGNTLTKMDEPAESVYLIKSGYVRLYLDVQIPRMTLPEAIQHLPSTKRRQRNKTERLTIVDIGPGEFVGGLEHLCDQNEYMFTAVATEETATYAMRSSFFKDIVLRPHSKSSEAFVHDMETRWDTRRKLVDFSLSPKTNEILGELLGDEAENKDQEEAKAELEALKSRLTSDRTRKKSLPHYMMNEAAKSDATRQSLRPPNRGPFADRVRNRMKELGFSSRRGI